MSFFWPSANTNECKLFSKNSFFYFWAKWILWRHISFCFRYILICTFLLLLFRLEEASPKVHGDKNCSIEIVSDFSHLCWFDSQTTKTCTGAFQFEIKRPTWQYNASSIVQLLFLWKVFFYLLVRYSISYDLIEVRPNVLFDLRPIKLNATYFPKIPFFKYWKV